MANWKDALEGAWNTPRGDDDAREAADEGLQVATLIVEKARPLSTDELADLCADQGLDDVEVAGAEDGTVSAWRDEDQWVITPVDQPFPRFREAAARQWTWADPEAAIEANGGHVLVVGPRATRLRHRLQFTRFVADLASRLNALAVAFGPHGVLHGLDTWLELGLGAKKNALPTPLWVHLDVAVQEDGGVSVLTYGLDHFKLPEVWLRLPPQSTGEDAAFAWQVAEMLLGGTRLRDGETIGPDDDTRWPVQRTRSPDTRDQTVLAIEAR